ncbi:hypothetical protein [Pseudomonas sp. AS2.8]|uniref:hypothetical protein n=1 Tax=Pseudomonas sp. AS2.8 TaxID=2587128 RepID=UPI00160DC28B|nr:hypothetical protein [Pseudomonas sp. AS2.8]MBB2895530.1 hypothetical protein [Pseudomonas sp. AS2.8]
MGMEDNEFQTTLQQLGQLNLDRIMEQARVDRDFMNRVVTVLEECGVDDRTDEENSLLKWARAFQRLPGKDADR